MVNGIEQQNTKYLQSPEFAVGKGRLKTHDTQLESNSDKSIWLLSAEPFQTYVACQTNPHEQLPVTLETPIAKLETKRYPFGKLVVSKTSENEIKLGIHAGFRPFWSNVHWRAQVWQELGTHPSDIWIQTEADQVSAHINGDEIPVVQSKKEGRQTWLLDPYAMLPRVRDRLATPGSERFKFP